MEDTTLFFPPVNITDSDYYYNGSGTGNDTVHPDKYTYKVLVICFAGILSLVSLLGITGNGLIIWFSIFRMKKTVNVVWILNLAVADFSYSFSVLLVILGYFMYETFIYEVITYFLVRLNINVSVLQLTVISIDRCICVVFPVWCHNHRRPRLAFLVAVTIWLFSLAFAISSVIFLMSSPSITVWGILNFFFFLPPLVIIVFCYIVIVLHIRRKRIIPSSKPFKSIVAIIIAFFICNFPYYVLSFLFETGIYINYYVDFISFVLMSLNCCINPIIYVFIGRDFKEKFCGSFQAKFEKAFIENEDKTDFEKQERFRTLTRLHQHDREELYMHMINIEIEKHIEAND